MLLNVNKKHSASYQNWSIDEIKRNKEYFPYFYFYYKPQDPPSNNSNQFEISSPQDKISTLPLHPMCNISHPCHPNSNTNLLDILFASNCRTYSRNLAVSLKQIFLWPETMYDFTQEYLNTNAILIIAHNFSYLIALIRGFCSLGQIINLYLSSLQRLMQRV